MKIYNRTKMGLVGGMNVKDISCFLYLPCFRNVSGEIKKVLLICNSAFFIGHESGIKSR